MRCQALCQTHLNDQLFWCWKGEQANVVPQRCIRCIQLGCDGKDRWCMLTYVSSSALECTKEKLSAGRRRILDIPATI